MSAKHWLIGLVMPALAANASAQDPAGQVELKPARWRAVRQIIQAAADQAGFRWAMPAPISRSNNPPPRPVASSEVAISMPSCMYIIAPASAITASPGSSVTITACRSSPMSW